MTKTFSDNINDLVIQMVASGKYLIFRDGIDSFDRSYSVQWESVNVYGRQDAIQTYQSTGETISLSWPLKLGTEPSEYNEQLNAILALGKFVRPLYTECRIKESPLLRIQYRNLVVENLNNEGTGTPLLIAPTSISVNYGDRARDVISPDGTKLVVPKRIIISLSGVVINTTPKYYSTESISEQKRDQTRAAVNTGGPVKKAEQTAVLSGPGNNKCHLVD